MLYAVYLFLIFINPYLIRIYRIYLYMYRVFQKKTPTDIIGYKLNNICLISIIFDTEILHII